MEKKIVVGDGFFDELFEQEHFRAVDDGVDAVLEGFHRHEGLERFAEQKNGGVAALVDGHFLQRLEREIFLDGVGTETLLDDDDLIMRLAEANEEITVRRGGVNLVAEFVERLLGGFEPFRRGERDQGRLVIGADEIE